MESKPETNCPQSSDYKTEQEVNCCLNTECKEEVKTKPDADCSFSESKTDVNPISTEQKINQEKPFIKLYLNQEIVPQKFNRYRHPLHKHRMFMLTGIDNHNCDSCRENIKRMDVIFSCFRCNFDLCGNCFQIGSDKEVPLADDDKDVNETTIKLISIAGLRLECFNENDIDSEIEK